MATLTAPRDKDFGAGYDLRVLASIFVTVFGMALDLWAHLTKRVSNEEGFFTLWHLVMYTGIGLVVIHIVWPVIQGLRQGKTIRQSVPMGYLWAFYGVPIIMLGGLGDAVWHTLFGVEIGTEALVSPSHILLMIGLFALLSAPFRAMCLRRQPGSTLEWRADWPGLVSLGFVWFFIVAVFWYANSIFITYRWYTPSAIVEWGLRVPTELGNHIVASAPAEMLEMGFVQGALSILFTTFTLLFVLMTVGRRYRLPIGFWAMLFAFGSLHAFLYKQTQLFVVALVAGVLVEVLLRALDYRRDERRLRLATVFMPALFHAVLMFAAVIFGNWWTLHVLLGFPLFAGLIGGLIGLVIKPPEFLSGDVTD
jgi:hypothetical protein